MVDGEADAPRCLTRAAWRELVTTLAARDRGLASLRRSARAAIIVPAMFALGDKVIGNPAIATFAAFGSFALLLLVDFGGSRLDRMVASGALGGAGCVLVSLGTLASRHAATASLGMGVVAFVVLFSGVVSSVLAGASTALLLSFILPVTQPADPAVIPDRIAGWAMSAAVASIAVAVLWPSPPSDPLRARAIASCRALGARLRTDAACRLGTATPDAYAATVAAALEAVEAMRRGFLATPYRPTGLSTSARAGVRLVDELTWLADILARTSPEPAVSRTGEATCAVHRAAADVLEAGADLLADTTGSPAPLRTALVTLQNALDAMEHTAIEEMPARGATVRGSDTVTEAEDVVTALDPSFRAQELSFAVASIGGNIDLVAAADRRSYADRLLGHGPRGLPATRWAAQQRAGAHVERHSVWLHNSVRGAIALAVAVLLADLTGVQHSFWVVLGTLSVLRSNALTTGQTVARGVLGTAVGFLLAAALLAVIGTDPTVLWCLLPLAVLLAGTLPAMVSFAAGQAAFTVVLVILYNIIQPAGWKVGLVRVEDIAIGCAVSLVVGLLFWPRGASSALQQALARAYEDSSRYLLDAVARGLTGAGPPSEAETRAAAASRRLDDTFRTYLAERGAKPTPFAEMTGLVSGVTALRLAADAITALWREQEPSARSDVQEGLLRAAQDVTGWYGELARHLTAGEPAPPPLDAGVLTDRALLDAIRQRQCTVTGAVTPRAIRTLWTADHLDAVRRVQHGLVGSTATAWIDLPAPYTGRGATGASRARVTRILPSH
jgi:hypothetical protein